MIPVHLNNLKFMVRWENFVAIMPLVYYNTNDSKAINFQNK